MARYVAELMKNKTTRHKVGTEIDLRSNRPKSGRPKKAREYAVGAHINLRKNNGKNC